MSEHGDNIEAQLCAYIDGQLDPAQRAQLEEHLRNNPQHWKLVEQLIRDRQALTALPREPAPDDLLESIQQRIERSALLDDRDARPAGLLRMRAWPRYMAAAAIVLLAVGLAAIVYLQVLPPLGMQPPAVVQANRHAPVAMLESEPVEPTTVATAGPLADSPEVMAAPTAEGDATTAPFAEQPLVLLVNTTDPSSARRELAAFLESNNLSWDPQPAPTAIASDAMQQRSATATALQNQQEVYVVRKVTPQQVRELQNSVASQGQYELNSANFRRLGFETRGRQDAKAEESPELEKSTKSTISGEGAASQPADASFSDEAPVDVMIVLQQAVPTTAPVETSADEATTQPAPASQPLEAPQESLTTAPSEPQ